MSFDKFIQTYPELSVYSLVEQQERYIEYLEELHSLLGAEFEE